MTNAYVIVHEILTQSIEIGRNIIELANSK